jgi:hypothetical protein
VESAGLAFQGWFYNAPYYPHTLRVPDSDLYTAINALPPDKMWSVMENLHWLNGCHFFMACRRDRPPASCQVDFSSPDALDYVPTMRYRSGLDGLEMYRPDWRMKLNLDELPFARYVDGTRSIRDIAARVIDGAESRFARPGDVEAYARGLFESLWRLDFVSMAMKPRSNPLFR